jgi:NADP oxidoreductase coenzyme F420-dependent
MRIGFIGAGGVAQTISRHVLPFGHRVLLSNTRGPESLAKLVKELGTGAEAGTPQQAAEQDLVVLAVMWAARRRGSRFHPGLEGSRPGRCNESNRQYKSVQPGRYIGPHFERDHRRPCAGGEDREGFQLCSHGLDIGLHCFQTPYGSLHVR